MTGVVERIEIVLGDITEQKVDAIVNAANTTLLGGGGVDGAIHRAAGPELLRECKQLGGCSTGEAKITQGYNLHAKYVIHTVGPVWGGGKSREEELLRNCYLNTLKLAKQYGAQTVAFPSISTGAYRFPIERAAKIALNSIIAFLDAEITVKRVTIVCFSNADLQVYKRELSQLKQS